MKVTYSKWVLGLACFAILFVLSSPARAAEWRLPVGFTYINGFGDVVDLYKDNLRAEGYWVEDTSSVSVGLSFQPYIQFDSGIGIGGSIGPVSTIIGDAYFIDVPVGIDLRYAFIPRANISPYARAGVRYHLADGDYVTGSSPGLFGGIGVEFLRRTIGFGFEVSYDSAEVEFERYSAYYADNEKIKPYRLMVSAFAAF